MKKLIFAFALLMPYFLSAQEAEYCTMRFQGYEREYYLYVPDSLDAGRSLVFMLHGHSGKAKGYYPDFLKDAQKYGFALCYPQGLVEPRENGTTAWNVGYPFQEGWDVDDCAFILALGKKIQEEYKLNPRNMFLSGMSNGGEMCYLMAHKHSEKFAAIASLAGLEMEWIYRTMKPSSPVAFMEVHGTKDMTSKWVGDPQNNDGWGKYISVPAAVGRMVSTNCCTHEVVDTLPVIRNVVIRHQYLGGTEGKDVVLYEIVNGVHSRGEDDMPLGDVLWEFFKKYITY